MEKKTNYVTILQNRYSNLFSFSGISSIEFSFTSVASNRIGQSLMWCINIKKVCLIFCQYS